MEAGQFLKALMVRKFFPRLSSNLPPYDFHPSVLPISCSLAASGTLGIRDPDPDRGRGLTRLRSVPPSHTHRTVRHDGGQGNGSFNWTIWEQIEKKSAPMPKPLPIPTGDEDQQRTTRSKALGLHMALGKVCYLQMSPDKL